MKTINIKWMKIGLIIICLMVVSIGEVTAQFDKTRLTKNISKSFSTEANSTIEISNKYGQVIVNTWEYDSVLVKIEVTAYGKNDVTVEKMMQRVDFDFNNFGDYLTIETILDRKSGFFKEMWNNLGDYSKTLLSKNKLNIDYEITIPEKSTFNLDNKFGNVYVNTLSGKSKIKVAHGNFKANKLEGETKLYLSFGKGNIQSIQSGYLELKGADIDISSSQNIDIESSSSQIHLDEVTSLKLNSRNDKVRIEKVRFMTGKAGFSNIIIDSMVDNMKMDLNYGEFMMNKISSNFSKIQLLGKSADINLNFDLDSYFDLELTGKSELIFLSRNMKGLDKTIDSEKEDYITLKGKIGNKKGKESQVSINAKGGNVYLFTQDMGGITKEN